MIALSLASAISLAAIPAHADITPGGLLGAIAGGLLGAQVGQGNGRVAASALGAVLGYDAGQSQSPYAPPQAYYNPPPRVYYAPPPGAVSYVPARPDYEDDGYHRYRRHYRGDDDWSSLPERLRPLKHYEMRSRFVDFDAPCPIAKT